MAPRKRKLPQKIDYFFDDLEHVLERTEQLVNKSKPLIFGMALMLLLIYELIIVFRVLTGAH